MSKTSSAIEVATRTCKAFSSMCDLPVLSSLKPLGSVLVIICEHVWALKENKEAAITLADRVGLVAQVLVNCAEDRGAAMPNNYSHQIGNLNNILFDIAEALQMLRWPKSQWLHLVQIFSPKTTNAALNQLSSKLDSTLWVSTFSTCCEIRRDIQSVRTHLQEGGGCPGSSELRCPGIESTEIDSGEELYSTDDYSVQVGTYRNQEVIIRKYYTEKEKIFLQDLNQRLDQTHPGIAVVLGISKARRIILLRAQDLIFCTQDVADIDSIRRPWQERRIGPPIPSVDSHTGTGETCSTSAPTQSAHSAPNDDETLSTPSGILTVKESDALLQQFISVVKFLRRMGVEVSWWQFKPSWVALRQNKHVVLIDWAEDSKSGESEFEPRYAIHLMGLGFSDLVPHAFQELVRSLTEVNGTGHVPVPMSLGQQSSQQAMGLKNAFRAVNGTQNGMFAPQLFPAHIQAQQQAALRAQLQVNGMAGGLNVGGLNGMGPGPGGMMLNGSLANGNIALKLPTRRLMQWNAANQKENADKVASQ